jgi:LPXTG-site transpeptidase (sortase) family protein
MMRDRKAWGLLLALVLLTLPGPAQAGSDMHLYIPALALDKPIGECPLVDRAYDTTHLGQGVCHLEGTATLEDDWARIVLAGHTPGGFSNLHRLRVGDDVLVWDAQTVEHYRVVLITITTPDDTSWLFPTQTETLTLITCTSGTSYRLVVHADRIR